MHMYVDLRVIHFTVVCISRHQILIHTFVRALYVLCQEWLHVCSDACLGCGKQCIPAHVSWSNCKDMRGKNGDNCGCNSVLKISILLHSSDLRSPYKDSTTILYSGMHCWCLAFVQSEASYRSSTYIIWQPQSYRINLYALTIICIMIVYVPYLL